MTETEQIIFVDEQGVATGETGPKLASHTGHTKLHMGFSCYIFRRSDHAFLLTQRALTKKVWPGVWTNSVCGHPGPGETIQAAIMRRAGYELGITDLQDIQVVLPSYRYTTPLYDGIIENEFCPVYIAYTSQEPAPNHDEVEEYHWLTWNDYTHRLQHDPDTMSYWAKDQYAQLCTLQPFVDYAGE